MAPREDLNLPEARETEAAADSTPEGTDQEVPEPAMAAVQHSPSTSKVPSPAPESSPPAQQSSSTPAKEVEEPAGASGGGGAAGTAEILRDTTNLVSEGSNNHRGSTFMTEVDDCEDAAAGPGAAAANLAATMADIAEKIVTEGVEVLGGIEDVTEKKETTPAKAGSADPVKEESPAPVKEASPEPVKEVSPEPFKDSSSDPVKEASPGPVKDASPEPVKEASPGPVLEPIGAVEDLKAEVNALLSSSDRENVEVIDISVIEEPENSANDVEPEIEAVLNEIPEKQEIIEEAKEILDDIEIQPKEPATGTVIDIRVFEEPKEEVTAQDIVKASQEAFVAEVIPDNADVEIVAEDGEEDTQDSPPSPMVTEAPTPDMEEDVIHGLGAIQESPEEAAADVEAKQQEDEPASHEPSIEETNESKTSPVHGETKPTTPEEAAPEKDEVGTGAVKAEETEVTSVEEATLNAGDDKPTVEDETVLEENTKDEATPVAVDEESAVTKVVASDKEEAPCSGETEAACTGESESPVSEQNNEAEEEAITEETDIVDDNSGNGEAITEETSDGDNPGEAEKTAVSEEAPADVTTGESDEPEATTEDITAPVDPMVEEISVAEATLGSDDSLDSDGGETAGNEAEGGEASPEEDSETAVGGLKATTLIDITVIEETDDTATDSAVLEAASTNAQVELEAALSEIPEIPAESVQQILQEARVSVAEEGEEAEDSLKTSSRGWCCYVFVAVLLALIAVAIAAAYMHREELALLYDPPAETEEDTDSGYWYFSKGLTETFAAAE